MSELTQAQRDQMERNKQQALQRRAERLLHQNAASNAAQIPPTAFYNNKPSPNTPNTVQTTLKLFPRNGEPNSSATNSSPRLSWISSSTATSNSKPSTSRASSSFSSKTKPTPISINSPFKQKATGQCSLISKERFVVDMPFHKRSIELFKMLKTAIYDSQTKKWNFHIKEHEALRLKLKEVAAEVSLGYLPDVILKTFQKLSASNQPSLTELACRTDLSRIDPVLLSKLMPFQKEGVCFGVLKEGRCLIADDMGLGKTIQALGIAHYYKEDWPLLIVTPSSVRFLWEEAILSWLPSVAAHNVVVMTTGADYIKDAHVLIISYDLLSRHEKDLKSMRFGAVIMDECHFLKNMKSARSKAGLALVADARRVLLLSGTPALSRPAELFSQLKAIDPEMFPWFQAFGIRYCDGKKGRFGWNFAGSSNMMELQLLLEAKFMIRRLKADVLTQLPDKSRQMIVLNPGSVKIASKEMTNFEKMLKSTDLKGMDRRSTLMEYYAETGRAKIKAIQDFIGDLIESGQKFICFAHHREVMDGICEFMITKKSKCIRIDGSTPARDRQQLCDSFQTDSTVAAAILSITAANAGITLTAANLVVFAELFWNPGILTQAEDRAHRIGQRDCVTVQYLVARGTADDHIWPLIIQKLDVLNKAGLSKDNFMDSHSVELPDPNQPNIESFFQDLSETWFDDGADSWLAEIDLNNLVPEKRQKLDGAC